MTNIDPTVNEVDCKVATVTGAASGFGRAIFELLSARGAKVVAEDIDPTVQGIAPTETLAVEPTRCDEGGILRRRTRRMRGAMRPPSWYQRNHDARRVLLGV